MRHDALVIGGSFAGLSAAMQLARARRAVCVVDAGEPRNRFAAAAHGFFGLDGVPPLELMAQARAKLLAYPNVHFVQGRATGAAADAAGGFTVTLDDGASSYCDSTRLDSYLLQVLFLVPAGAGEGSRLIIESGVEAPKLLSIAL